MQSLLDQTRRSSPSLSLKTPEEWVWVDPISSEIAEFISFLFLIFYFILFYFIIFLFSFALFKNFPLIYRSLILAYFSFSCYFYEFSCVCFCKVMLIFFLSKEASISEGKSLFHSNFGTTKFRRAFSQISLFRRIFHKGCEFATLNLIFCA